MSRSFSANFRRVSPWNFTLGEISNFYFSPRKKIFCARGVSRRNAKKELFSWADLYIAPGQEQTTPWWQSFDVIRKLRSLWLFVASFKMISLNSDFIYIFKLFYTSKYPRGKGRSTFWCHQKALTTSTICFKFKKISLWILIYTHFLTFFPHVYSPGAGQTTPGWQNSDVNRKALSLCPFVASFQKNIFEVWFYTYSYLCPFLYMYIAPGQRQTTLCGQNSDMSTERHYHYAYLLQVSKKYLWSLILYIFMPVFIHVYSPGAGADNPLGSEYLF